MADLFLQVERWRKTWGRGEKVLLPLQSDDMKPYVHSGDTLEFTEARLMDLRTGDFVLTYRQGQVRLRRLIERFITADGERFVVQACNVADSQEECGFEDILAKAESISRAKVRLWERGEGVWRLRWRRFWYRKKIN